VPIIANTTYVASYFAPNGRFALDNGFFATAGVDSQPLHALRDGVDGPNGLFKTGSSGFPTQSHQASNYWVDVVFATTATDTIAAPLIRAGPGPHPGKA